jgi:hypothetical protein
LKYKVYYLPILTIKMSGNSQQGNSHQNMSPYGVPYAMPNPWGQYSMPPMMPNPWQYSMPPPMMYPNPYYQVPFVPQQSSMNVDPIPTVKVNTASVINIDSDATGDNYFIDYSDVYGEQDTVTIAHDVYVDLYVYIDPDE